MQEGIKELKSLNKLSGQQPTVIPVFSFISQMVCSLRAYLKSRQRDGWARYIASARRSKLASVIASWRHHKESLECQLLGSFLVSSDKNKARLYLRVRKYICQFQNADMLDDILLKHEDVITIVHRIFSEKETRRAIVEGIKRIFISFKLAQAKIHSCVFVEYILSHISQLPPDALLQNQSNSSNVGDFSSVLHKENGMYRKNSSNHSQFHIIDTKFLPTPNHFQSKSPSKYMQSSSDKTLKEESMRASSISLYSSDFTSVKKKLQDIVIQEDYDDANQDKGSEAKGSEAKGSEAKGNSARLSFKPTLFLKKPLLDMEDSKIIEKLIERNRQFKERILERDVGEMEMGEMEMGEDKYESINSAMHILHRSVGNKNKAEW